MHMAGNDEARLGLRQRLAGSISPSPKPRQRVLRSVELSSIQAIFLDLEVIHSIEFWWYF
jgi:hypothetical protein